MERLQLAADQHVRLTGGTRWRIACVDGLVWITAENQMHDWVLRAGESVEIAGNGILVGTLKPSELLAEPDAYAASPSPVITSAPRWRALLELFARRVWAVPTVGWPFIGPEGRSIRG